MPWTFINKQNFFSWEYKELIALDEIPHAVKAKQGLFVVWKCYWFFFFLAQSPVEVGNIFIETIVTMLKYVLLN